MLATVRAYATHALTASGAVVSLLALLAAVDGAWPAMFGWLGIALVIDGIDGPLARRYDARGKAPIIDGVILDLVVDFLSYVFVPVFALLASGVVSGPAAVPVALVVAFGSALYFADTRMKTADRSFSGFPACWNMVALVLFVLRPPTATVLGILVGLAALMFAPLRFIHPVRTRSWRPLSLGLLAVWALLAARSATADLTLDGMERAAFLAISIALLIIGPVQQFLGVGTVATDPSAPPGTAVGRVLVLRGRVLTGRVMARRTSVPRRRPGWVRGAVGAARGLGRTRPTNRRG